MARRYLDRGWLERDGSGLTKNEMIIDGTTHRCYVLRAAALHIDEAPLAPESVAA